VSEWDDLSDAEKQFIEGEISQNKAEITRAFHSVWNGGRCKDCGDPFGDDPLNMQSHASPSLCVVCCEYRSNSFEAD
jgi:hypothetical protein